MTSTSVAEAKLSEAASAPARSRAETRRRLVEAGTELFAERGLHASTTALIARRAGVASGTFYLHFKDKRSLFREIVFAAIAELRERQAQAVAVAAPGAEAELRSRFATLVAYAQEKRDLWRIVFGREHAAGSIGEDVLDALVPGIERRLRERQTDGEIDTRLDAAVAAQAVAAMMVRCITWWVEDPARTSREALLETLYRLHPFHAAPGGD